MAVCALLGAVVQAGQVLEGRVLHEDKENSRSNYFTDKFAAEEGTFGPPAEASGANLAGLVIGFLCTGFFIIFAVITLICDEI